MKLKNLTFKGGLHLPEFKELSEHCKIEAALPVEELIIPLSQHVGAPCEPTVKVGDEVKVGTVIGDLDVSLYAPVHSSVSGTVTKIEDRFTLDGSVSKCVIIKNDFKDELAYEIVNKNLEDISVEEIIESVKKAGVVGMGGAAFPAHNKLAGATTGVDSVILNGAECEPYLTCDHRMMLEWSQKIIDGLRIIMKVTNAKHGYIGIEDNKKDAIEHLTKELSSYENLHVAELKTKFPQGDSYRMVDSILNRKVPMGGRTGNVNALVTNVGTAAAIADAVLRGIPSYERVVTVTGDGIKNPHNYIVRVGTPIGKLIEMAGGFNGSPKAIIGGGPMTGFSQFDMSTPIQKNSSGLLVIKEDPSAIYEMTPCIRCAKCVEACPVHLMPLNIARLASVENFEETEKYRVSACIACGSCSYICPAHRPLTELVTAAKRELKARSRKAR
ncbi:MAG: electron transport complex subunit RsxC [Ezakiella sp.]|nr:electron transport complex subunit RsxC [Ezakiella sp.]